MTPEEIDKLAAVLRKHGIIVFKDGDLILQLFYGASLFGKAEVEVEFPSASSEPVEGAPPPIEWCACGHSLITHNEGGCLLGCDTAKCESAEPTAEPQP